ncbi:MAG: triose-phosphate isomerase [Deltaproteobacteria bacterium]|nr:triose-phosphate isomerase [Deltaproteobacteria bacterium]
MIKPLIVGNWKMHKTTEESLDFVRRLLKALGKPLNDRDVAIAPPFTALYPVAGLLRGSRIGLAAQNVHDAAEGAYTGEISTRMLVDAGCSHVIIGHSERRTLFGEGNDLLCRKEAAALNAGLRPIYCIGETLDERERGSTFAVIERQIKEGLNKFSAGDIGRTIIAYEPVWAIGTGRTATPAQAQEVHAFVRKMIEADFGAKTAAVIPVLYGGSVNPANIGELMAQPDINGALVGGASLKVESFLNIVRFDK